MRKALRPLILAIGLFGLLASNASAQLAVGLTGGVNSSTLTGSGADTLDVSSKTGGGGGVYGNIYLGSRFSAEGQLLFLVQGVDVNSVSADQGIIQVPMLLKVYFGKLNIFAGPAIGWEVSCSADAAASVSCDSTNSSAWFGIAGAGLQFGRLGVEAHYSAGLSDAATNLNASFSGWSLMARLAILGSR